MDHQDAGVEASVLVDTTGQAQGVALHSNDTTVSFVSEAGAVYKADVSGFDVIELLDYCEDDSLGTDGTTACAGRGLDYWDYSNKLYFVDANLGYLMSSSYDGTDASVMVSGIDSPYARPSGNSLPCTSIG